MQKTKLGISVGLFGAAVYFLGLFSGYVVTAFLVGYILLFEENEWLKKTAVKALMLMILFSIAISLVGLITNATGIISGVAAVFGGNFYVVFLSNLVGVIIDIIQLVEKVLFLVLGMKALNQSTIAIPMVDRLISKYM